jgi:mxaD protein
VYTTEVRGEIAVPPSAAWALLGDFGGVASWNPFVESAEISGVGVGMTRVITARGGARIVETLERLDAEARRLRYSVQLETGAQSTADIRLDLSDAGETVVVWQSIREAELSQEEEDAVAATLRSRIDALAQAVSPG